MSAPHPALSTATADSFAAALQRPADLSVRHRRVMVLAVACAHMAGLWGLLQVDSVRAAVREMAPMMVDLVAPESPPQPPPPPPPSPPQRLQPAPQTPILAAPAVQPVPTEAFTAPAPIPAPTPVAEVAAPPAPPAAPSPSAPAPPPRKVISATAVRYLVVPPFEVPRAARRAGEHGVVWLRVVVSPQGEPLQVRVQRTSGYARLDEQALWAMRQARFQPHTEDGRPIEVEVTAPVEYPQE